MSNDIRDIIERLAILEGRITPVDVKHGLNADQKAVKQLPALFKPKDISPTLSKPPYQKHPMDGWLVGEEEETDEAVVMAKDLAIHDPAGERFANPDAEADVNVAAKWKEVNKSGGNPTPGWAAGYPKTDNKNVDVRSTSSTTTNNNPTEKFMGPADVVDVDAKEVKEALAKMLAHAGVKEGNIPDRIPSTLDVINYKDYVSQMKNEFGADWTPDPEPMKPYDTKALGPVQYSQPPVEEETDKPLVELDYAHDFRGWQRDAQAAGLEIKRQPQDETGNMTNSFIAVKPGNEDSSGGVKVGHFDGQKGGGILAASPEEYQSTISGGFGQHMDQAYEKDVNRLYTGQDVVKKIAELAGCKVNEVAPDEQGGSTGGSVEFGTIPHDDINLDADDIPWHKSGTFPGEPPAISEAKVDEEKLLDKVKKSLTDYLASVEEKLEKKIDRDLGAKPADHEIGKKDKKDRDLLSRPAEVEQEPAAELEEDPTEEDPVVQAGTTPLQDPTYAESACVKSFVLENGKVFEIHGDEHSGFEIRHGNRSMKSRFKNIDEATSAIEMFRARQQQNNQSQDYIEEA